MMGAPPIACRSRGARSRWRWCRSRPRLLRRDPGAVRSVGRSAGRRALDRRGQPGSGAHQRHRIARGRRAGLRPPGALRRRPARARARSRDELVGQRRRHDVDVRAAPGRPLPRRHAVRRRRGRVLVRAADHPRAPGPRGRLRLDARVSQHPPRARGQPAARAVRDRSPVRAVPRQPGDGPGGDRVARRRCATGGATSDATRSAPGPYRFVEWIPGDRITLERNPDYWDQPARTRYLVLLAMPDSRQRLQALESGAADVIQQLAPDDLPLVRLHPDLRLAMAPATLVSYLAMNTQRRPLNDPAHPARDRPRHPPRRAGQARLPGARHPGDRPAAAQRLGRALRRRHLPVRSGARAQAARRGGLAGESRGAAEAVRAVGGEPVHAGARARRRASSRSASARSASPSTSS